MSLILSALPLSAKQINSSGRLVIVGGALSSQQSDIYDAFLQNEKARSELKVSIIPAASSKPSLYGNQFKTQLINHGLRSENITVLPLAVKDDSSTNSVDESTWGVNVDTSEVLQAIKDSDIVWFTGGDQSRITKLLGDYQSPTKTLKALQTLLQAGGTIGGTSAGAAIMSETMIVGGSSLGALLFPESRAESVNQEDGALLLGKGLGFFPYGVIDQHFDAKARLGRLVVASKDQSNPSKIGLGIDENTALVVDLKSQTGRVAGSGQVTFIDLSNARIQPQSDSNLIRYQEIVLSSFGSGDTIHLDTSTILPAPDKSRTKDNAYYQIANPLATGILSGYSTLNQLISYKLVDNAASATATSYLFNPESEFGYEITFSETNSSEGFWSYRNGQEDHYTVIGIHMALNPIRITVEPLDD